MIHILLLQHVDYQNTEHRKPMGIKNVQYFFRRWAVTLLWQICHDEAIVLMQMNPGFAQKYANWKESFWDLAGRSNGP